LVEAILPLGEVVVVAPDSPQSGMGHAITVNGSIWLRPSQVFGPDVLAYASSGTPADCVKLAKHLVLGERTPDLVVSGINHGSNSSISIIYSGTMSAAMEAAIEWVPAVGFSLCDHGDDADFSHCVEPVRKIAERLLRDGLPKGIVLNVNIPAKTEEPIKGIRVCRQTDGYWKEEFDLVTEEGPNPNAPPDLSVPQEFMLRGHFVNRDGGAQDNDIWALEHNYIAVVPAQYDLTAYNALATLQEEWNADH
jgi:5'-nucleotidase